MRACPLRCAPAVASLAIATGVMVQCTPASLSRLAVSLPLWAVTVVRGTAVVAGGYHYATDASLESVALVAVLRDRH